MGHSSIANLNKVGQSMYWNSMWDNKHIYNRFLHETMFLQEFVPYFFEHFSYRVFFSKLNNQNYLNKNLKKYNIFLKNKYNHRELYKSVFVKNKEKYFFSKIWVLKFQKWLILYFFLYSRFFKKKNYNLFKKKFNYNHIILQNFFKNTIKLKYNSYAIDKGIFKKYLF